MIVYLDSSVILSHLLKQKNALNPWGEWKEVCVSQINQLEAFRTFYRLRMEKVIDDEKLTELIQKYRKVTEQAQIIQLDASVFENAERPFATPIKALDAIHLASALLWQEDQDKELVFVTHDIQLGRAALASGLKAKGF